MRIVYVDHHPAVWATQRFCNRALEDIVVTGNLLADY
jgi:hypothetical protein